MKRATDIVLSGATLIFLAPLFLAVAIAIKLDSKGPVFFCSIRMGKDGMPFKMFKFRSMIADAQRVSAVVSTPEDDPRITKLGHFLRKYNLDELPQFVNVLLGEMSIVGPRPEVPQYVAMFTEEEKSILSVRPGITDWASVWIKDKGRILAGSIDPEADYMKKIRPEKLRLQIEYVRNHSWWRDLKIMLLTFKTHVFDRIFARG
jgi:lipopolysaccharide/colanic/teichoic acid biosynthesis glycosyltransferase